MTTARDKVVSLSRARMHRRVQLVLLALLRLPKEEADAIFSMFDDFEREFDLAEKRGAKR